MFDLASTAAFFEALTGYRLEDEQLLHETFDTSGHGKVQANQRLALVGVKTIDLILVHDWYHTNARKGVADSIIQEVACNDNLQRVARAARIAPHVIVNAGHTGPVGAKALATTLEAIIGVIWVHSNADTHAVRAAMIKIGLTLQDLTYNSDF